MRVTLEEELATFFKDNRGQVAIYDANVSGVFRSFFKHSNELMLLLPLQNGTKAARIALRQKFEAQGVNVFFIGSLHLPLVPLPSSLEYAS